MRDIIFTVKNMKSKNPIVRRLVSSVVTILIIAAWVMPAHICAEAKHGATIHCAEVDEFDTSALLVQDGAFIVGLQVLSCPRSHCALIPQLSVSTIYRPPKA
jgi:hypothetical protein